MGKVRDLGHSRELDREAPVANSENLPPASDKAKTEDLKKVPNDSDSWLNPDAIIASLTNKDSNNDSKRREVDEALQAFLQEESKTESIEFGPAPAPLEDASQRTESLGQVKLEDSKDPHAPAVARWRGAFMRALKGIRLYPADNPILVQYIDSAHHGLQALHEQKLHVVLRVREDRLYYKGVEVHVEAEQYEGLSFTLFRNSIQQLDFSPGVTRDELWRFLQLLSRDHALEERGEDLVTMLWRMELPHISYVVFDILTVDPRARMDGALSLKDEETVRLKSELESIVEQLQGAEVLDEDELRSKAVDALGTPTSNAKVAEEEDFVEPEVLRGVLDLPSLYELSEELSKKNEHDALMTRLTELLLSVVRVERDPGLDTPAWALLENLLLAVIKAHHFEDLLRLTERVEALPEQERALVERLLDYICKPQILSIVLQAIELTERTVDAQPGQRLLRKLGARAYPGLLEVLETPEKSNTREFLCELILEYCQGPQEEQRLIERAKTLTSDVLRELLSMLERFPRSVRPSLIWAGVKHDTSQVRLRSVLALARYKGAHADRLIMEASRDPDPSVRMVALKVGAAHKSASLFDALERMIDSDGLSKLEAGELKLTLAAFTETGGERAVDVLAQLLTESGTLFVRKSSTDIQIAAAQALGMLGSPKAHRALERGAKTLNRRVNLACVQARASMPGSLFEAERVASHLREELPARAQALTAPPAPVSQSSPDRSISEGSIVMRERISSRLLDPRAEPDSKSSKS